MAQSDLRTVRHWLFNIYGSVAYVADFERYIDRIDEDYAIKGRLQLYAPFDHHVPMLPAVANTEFDNGG
jgi:hypothetical protein